MDALRTIRPDCELSLVLPAYDEEAGIARAVAEADDALRRLGLSYEVIVVDDGSRDGTPAEVCRAAANRPAVRLLGHVENRGYGAALRTGFEAARGRLVAFTDADCQFHLDDLAHLLPLTASHDVAAGYRVGRQDPWLRKVYSRGYNLLIRALLGTTVRDVDCALKVFRRAALARILPESRGFFINTEMLTRARQQGLTVAEAGVRHRPRERGASKVSVREIPRVLAVLLPFWWSQVAFAGGFRAALRFGVPLVLAALACFVIPGRLAVSPRQDAEPDLGRDLRRLGVGVSPAAPAAGRGGALHDLLRSQPDGWGREPREPRGVNVVAGSERGPRE